MRLASDVQRTLKKANQKLLIALIIVTLLLIGSNAFWFHRCSEDAVIKAQVKARICQVRVPRQYARKKAA